MIRADSIFIEAVPEGLKSQRSLLRYQISDRETAKIDSFFLALGGLLGYHLLTYEPNIFFAGGI